MKRQIVKDLVVFVVMLCVVGIIIYFLPNEVPIHINAQGEADMIVNKHFIFFGTIIPYSVYIQFFRKKKK